MLKIKELILTAVIIIFLIMTGCSTKKEEPTTTEIDLSQEAKEIEAFGLVKADDSKYITIDFPAEILDVQVKEGQYVKLNDPILTLDLSQYESLVFEKRSELNIARLELEGINEKLDELSTEYEDNEVKKLQIELDLLKKLYEQTVIDFISNEKLYNEGVISKDIFDKSKINKEEAKNKAELVEYELQQAVNSIEKQIESESQKSAIQAERIKQLEKSLTDLENKLNKTYFMGNQIVSEYANAAVFNIEYVPGEKTDTSKKAFGIVKLDKLIVEADVVEEFIKDVKVGASVRIVPIADRVREYEGKVIYISQIAFSKNGETVIPVRISIENSDSFIMPNYNVDVFINVK